MEALPRLRATLLAVALAAASGCGSPPRALGPVEPAFAPAFTEMAAAIDAGDDARARLLLDGILAREPAGDTLARAEAFGRILEGRRLARALDLALVVEPVNPSGAGRRVVLVLEAQHGLEQPLGLRPLPAMLKLLQTGVEPSGLEQRSARSFGIDELAELELPPGRVTRVPLGEFTIEPGSAMALRATFELEMAAGELLVGGQAFPANELEVRPCTLVRLAEHLPAAPVEPGELVRYLSGPRVALPALLERAVRIAPERRGETLDLLSVAAEGLTAQQLERAAPALRWVSGNRELGGDGEAWRRWLFARSWEPEPAPGVPEAPPPPVLALPESTTGS